MVEKTNHNLPQQPASGPVASKKSKKPKSKRFYGYRTFWFLLLLFIGLTVTGVINYQLNDLENQKKFADYIYTKSQTKLVFKDIKFDLFTGKLWGQELVVHAEKNQTLLTLNDFSLDYNPLYLWVGKFKITGIHAQKIFLDTSQSIKNKESKKKIDPKLIPVFLKHVHLKKAEINKFDWLQPKSGHVFIDEIKLTSKFGTVIHTSPLNLTIEGMEYRGYKHHSFFKKISFEGFFLFDFSNPLIFDKSKMSADVMLTDAVFAFHRRPKPWLTDDGWDKDLEPVLKQYYKVIPNNHTYLHVKDASLNLNKNKSQFRLSRFEVTVQNASLVGNGYWQLGNNQAFVNLQTKQPIDLSKMPLGQAKIRQAFEKFRLNLTAKGIVKDLKNHRLSVNLKAGLVGNLVNPPEGNVKAEILGQINNTQFYSDKVHVSLSDGSLNAKSHIDLKNLTTQTSFTAQNLDVQTVIRLFSSINFPSKADATGQITGSLKNPNIGLELSSPNAAYQFLNFGKAKARLNIKNKALVFDIESHASDVGESRLQMDVNNVFDSMVQVMKLNSSFENIKIEKLISAKHLTGNMGGTFDLVRDKGIISANAKVLAKDFVFFNHRVGFVQGEAKIHDKKAVIKPLVIELENPNKTLVSPTGITFDYDDYGYSFAGTAIEGLKLSGNYVKADKKWVHLKFVANDINLDILGSLLPVIPDDSKFSAKVDYDYNMLSPLDSNMQSHITKWYIKSPEGNFELNKPGGLNYQSRAFVFKGFDATVGKGRFVLNGPLGLEANSNLKVKGDVDFSPLVDYNPFISEAETAVNMDLTIKGDYLKPSIYGKVYLDKDTLRFRKVFADLSNIEGVLSFNGNRIHTDDLKLNFDDGPVKVKGFITTDYEKVTGADLSIKGREVPLYPFEGLSLLTDMDLKLKGHNQLTLLGDMNIVEGKYTHNFTITNFFIQPVVSELEEERKTLAGLPLNTKYNIHITNTGDMLIENNLADLEMNLDLDMKGIIENPFMLGQIDFLNGQIHAFGITFDDAKGFAQFEKNMGVFPNVTLTARKEIQGYNINASIDGKSENLRLKLFSTPALDHREILSLVFYGQTPDQLTGSDRRNFTQTAAISQLATLLADPLNKLSGLDMIEVTARYDRPQETVQRLTVGKKISDRFDLAFTTDLGISNPERAFELRYQVFDNIYLIVAKDIVGQNRYRFDMNLHFEAY